MLVVFDEHVARLDLAGLLFAHGLDEVGAFVDIAILDLLVLVGGVFVVFTADFALLAPGCRPILLILYLLFGGSTRFALLGRCVFVVIGRGGSTVGLTGPV